MKFNSLTAAAARSFACAAAAVLVACGGGGGGGTFQTAGQNPSAATPAAPAPSDNVIAPKAPIRISLLAGSLQRAGGQDGIGAGAQFNRPHGLAADVHGNVYIADTGSHTIRKLSPDGSVVTLAGAAGQAGASDGFGADARFWSPQGVAVDAEGNVYVADTGNHAIRKISPDGRVTVVAGSPGLAGDVEGAGGVARFKRPLRVAVDASGNLFVLDQANYKVRKIGTDGVVTTFWTGTPTSLSGIGVDGAGNVYVAENASLENHVRKLDRQGQNVSTFSTINGFSGGLFAADIAVAADGSVYVASGGEQFHYRYSYSKSSIALISPAGAVTLLAGADSRIGMADGPALAASFDRPLGIALGPRGEVFIADTGNSAIRQLDPTQTRVTTLAGGVGRGNLDGPAASARFHDPRAIAAVPDGSLYVADSGNLAVRRIGPDGTVSTVSPVSPDGEALVLHGLTGLAADRLGTVYLAFDGSVSPLRSSWLSSISPAGVGRTIYMGPASRLSIAVDGSSNLYSSDDGGLQVFAPGSPGRRLGSGLQGSVALAAGADGIVYVASASAVFVVDAFGNAKLVAGHAGEPGYRDGPGADSRFADICALALDPAGNLYIADASFAIRRLSADGTVSTIAGTPGQAGPAPGPAPGVLGAVKAMTWSGNALYLAVGNAILKLSLQD